MIRCGIPLNLALTRYTITMPLSERIVVDPEVLAGKPVIRGTRLAVEFVLEMLAAGQSESELLTSYPGLTREDVLACLSRQLPGARI
jgi:uncharacterized protein (DUF433 family)